MKFMPRSSATRTLRSASPTSTCRNSCPSDDAPKLRTGTVRPVLPRGRRSISLDLNDRLDHPRLRPGARRLELRRDRVEREAVRDPGARVDPAVFDQLDDPREVARQRVA